MAVTNLLTLMEDGEGTLGTLTSIGGGAGAGAETEIFFAGSQSIGRRSDNQTSLHGFFINVGATFNLSGAGQHVKIWSWFTHYKAVTGVQYRLGSSTTAYEAFTYPTTKIPALGGWFPAWLEVNAGTDTGTPDFTVIDEIAQAITIGDVAGNTNNNIMDQVHHGTSGMRWDGTGGGLSDFRTTEASNALGVFLSRDGIDYLFARLEIGSSTSTTFTATGYTIVFPDQPLCSTTFMGLTFDLQHASTAISMTGGTVTSGDPASAARRGDLIVTGTAGTLTLNNNKLAGLRLLTLNSKVTANNCVFSNTGQITANGADLVGSAVSGYEGSANTSAVVWDVNTDPDGFLDDMTFTKGTAATHAIELGTTSPTTVTLRGITFSGYNAADGQNDSVVHVKRTSGAVTIFAVACSGTMSYRSDGADVTVVSDPVTISVHVNDNAGANLENARVFLKATGGSGPFPADESVTITRSGSTATVSHTGHGMATNDKVVIAGADQLEYNVIFTITFIDKNSYSYTVSGTPATPATGTITSTFVALHGLTNASGDISASRVYSADQAVVGWVRKQSGTPYFRTSTLGGAVDSALGYTATVQMVLDQ